MFYTKLYALVEYLMEFVLVWSLFQISTAAGVAYLALRIAKFFLIFPAEQEIQTFRMREAVAQAKAMIAKMKTDPTTALNEEVATDVTLQ